MDGTVAVGTYPHSSIAQASPTPTLVSQRMALQALHRLGKLQQAAIGRPMGVVANGTVLDHRRVFEHLGPAHGLVAGETPVVPRHQGDALTAVGVVAVNTGNSAFLDRMVRPHVQPSNDVLVAVDAGHGSRIGFPEREVKLCGTLGVVNSVTCAAGNFGPAVVGKCPVSMFDVPLLVAGQALSGIRQENALAAFREMFLAGEGVALQAVAMVGKGLVSFVGDVAGQTGIASGRH